MCGDVERDLPRLEDGLNGSVVLESARMEASMARWKACWSLR